MEELRKRFIIDVEVLKDKDDIEIDQGLLKLMMSSEYPDAEVDKLIETLSMSGY